MRVYDISKVSLVDINLLIDKGRRFTLVADLDAEEYDDVEEDLRDDREAGTQVSKQGCIS